MGRWKRTMNCTQCSSFCQRIHPVERNLETQHCLSLSAMSNVTLMLYICKMHCELTGRGKNHKNKILAVKNKINLI